MDLSQAHTSDWGSHSVEKYSLSPPWGKDLVTQRTQSYLSKMYFAPKEDYNRQVYFHQMKNLLRFFYLCYQTASRSD